MRKLLKTLALVAIFGVVAYAGSAMAQYGNQQSSGGLSGVVNTLAQTFEDVRGVFYVLAAFGLIGLAAGALLGKIQWKWLWALVFGVAIVAAADYVVTYASGNTGGTGIQGGYDPDSM